MKKRQGRPKKDASERKDVDLRIPVTADQKRLITDAASSEERDMAAWARDALVKLARDRLRAEQKLDGPERRK